MAVAPASAKGSPQVVHVDRLSGMPQLAVVSPGNMARPRLAQPQQVRCEKCNCVLTAKTKILN